MNLFRLCFPYEFDEEMFCKLSNQWRFLPNVDITLPLEVLSGDKGAISQFIERVTATLPDELGFAILSYVVELEQLDDNMIRRLFEVGDMGMKISIALRSDVPTDILRYCLESGEEDILEHVVFNPRISINQCKALVAQSPSESLLSAIERAIEHKKATLQSMGR